MTVRGTMASLIQRTRTLINDTSGTPIFTDQVVQDVLDARRMDVVNGTLTGRPTYTGSTLQYLDYFSDWSDWEDSPVLKQYLVTTVTPSVSENIVGHWQFAANTFPPIFITGRTYCLYGAAADLLERLAAQWVLLYSVTVDGQSLQRSQATANLLSLARRYRMQQRAGSLTLVRSDIADGSSSGNGGPTLAPNALDYFASGDGG